VFLCSFLIGFVHAEESEDFLDLSLEELMQIEVSIAGHVSTEWKNTPAAVFVLTSDDIKRSGMRQIPELLRLVPGMHVAKMSGTRWSINSRNENGLYSGTMLVMVDGRLVYNSLFAGTYWDDVDVYLDDIERIEVIRGPGGSIWGSNAVTGVVNIISKSSYDTRGQHAYVGAGVNSLDYETGWRVGGGNDAFSWRAYVKNVQSSKGIFATPEESRNPSSVLTGTDSRDDSGLSQVGFRFDTSDSNGSVSVQGKYYEGKSHSVIGGASVTESTIDRSGYSFMTNWDTGLSEVWDFSASFYIDEFNRDSNNFIRMQNQDVGFKLIRKGAVHNLAFGGGFRDQNSRFTFMPGGFNLLNPEQDETKSNLFFQDIINVAKTLSMIVGGKLEDHSDFDLEWQPSIRMLWTANEEHVFWSAISRNNQQASLSDRGGYVDFSSLPAFACTPPLVMDAGLGCIIKVFNDGADHLEMTSYELGHRFFYGRTLTTDTAVFLEEFEDAEKLASQTAMDKVYGFETNIAYQYSDHWHLNTALTWHKGKTINNGVTEISRQIPKHAVNVQFEYTGFNRTVASLNTYYVDHVTIDGFEIPSYVRLDLSFRWELKDNIGMSLVLANLTDSSHVETVREGGVAINTAIEPSAFFKTEIMF